MKTTYNFNTFININCKLTSQILSYHMIFGLYYAVEKNSISFPISEKKESFIFFRII